MKQKEYALVKQISMEDHVYQQESVASLFDHMSKTYGIANYMCSFGFIERWRHACIQYLPTKSLQGHGVDLMSGGGELWDSIAKKMTDQGSLTAIDLSNEMNQKAIQNKQKHKFPIQLLDEDVLNPQLIKPNSLEFIVSSFGLKTFSIDQQQQLASNINRWLKPGGSFSFIEMTTPTSRLLKFLYMFYLRYVISFGGWLFTGDKSSYSMLGKYILLFGQGDHFLQALQKEGLVLTKHRLFFGCATCYSGYKKDL
ncbi:class I SAM-dependent methyltransferase [Shimazuella kribbensis]|uniref:class I SAM-dependent methyltransferase n=1 Tax=Shimazuella kribbensis TaxID=139808 RepID=UPI0004286976|nr:class I SAM-dependent methyltransferase [Shimazuella kribbensis]